MNTEHIDMLFSADHKVDKHAVTLSSQVLFIDVAVIMDYRIEEGREDRVRKRYFMVKEFDGSIQRIHYAENFEKWFYVS